MTDIRQFESGIPSTKVTNAQPDIDKAPEEVNTVIRILNEMQAAGVITMSTQGAGEKRILSISGRGAQLDYITHLLTADPSAPKQLPKGNEMITANPGMGTLTLDNAQSLYLLKIGGLKVGNLSDRENAGRLESRSERERGML